ncbi:MAG: hypothetical protein FWE87_02440 [Coriobacteriia bacterium]|nr:hypothetical protein [Coriobacteriia bacterium]
MTDDVNNDEYQLTWSMTPDDQRPTQYGESYSIPSPAQTDGVPDTMPDGSSPPRRRKAWQWLAIAALLAALLGCAGCALVAYLTARSRPDVVVEESVEQEPKYEVEPIPEALLNSRIVKVEGPEFTPATVTFSFNGIEHSITAQVENGVYYGAINIERMMYTDHTTTDELIIREYYWWLTMDAAMEEAVESVAAQLRAIRDEQGLDVASYAELFVKYVQSFPYDQARADAVLADEEPGEGDPRMPVQTLVDGTGDCDELSMLAAAILIHEDYGAAYFLFEEELHLALGIKSEGPGFYRSYFEYVEMTNPAYISEVPSEIGDDIALSSTPMILHIENGHLRYPQSAVDEVAYIIRARDTALEAAENKRYFIENTPLTQEEFDYHVALYDVCFVALNSFHSVVDEAGEPIADSPFMDRAIALQWLASNYWWGP